jgi:hypothetical protein
MIIWIIVGAYVFLMALIDVAACVLSGQISESERNDGQTAVV